MCFNENHVRDDYIETSKKKPLFHCKNWQGPGNKFNFYFQKTKLVITGI